MEGEGGFASVEPLVGLVGHQANSLREGTAGASGQTANGRRGCPRRSSSQPNSVALGLPMG